MATDSAKKSVHNTLSTTDADTITLTQAWDVVEIINHDEADLLYVTVSVNGVAPAVAVAGANDTEVVRPGGTLEVITPGGVNPIISVVGDGGAYSVTGVRRPG